MQCSAPPLVGHLADVQLFDAAFARGVVVALGDDHVAAVAPTLGQVTAPGRAFLHRRNHLQELAADGEHPVLQPEHGDARVDERDLDPEHVPQVGSDGFDVSRDESDLTEA